MSQPMKVSDALVLDARLMGKAEPLSACLKSMDSAEGRKRLADHLKTVPYPHFEPASDRPGLLMRIEANGRRTLGRFVNRKFQPVRSGKN